jgi:hypothetical protein
MRAPALLLLLFFVGCNGCNEVAAPARDAAVKDASPKDAPHEAEAAAAPPPESSFDALPDAGTADLDLRAKHLLEAIAQNDASLAADIVLPREAYLVARDAQDPAALYESKFKTGLEAQIARIHRHEKGIEGAVFVSFDLGQSVARATPHKHEWKEPLWRATRSTLTFTIDGRVHHVEIAEMIAWRGNWYVVKLK